MHGAHWAWGVWALVACGDGSSADSTPPLDAADTEPSAHSGLATTTAETGTVPVATGMTGLWVLTGCTGAPEPDPGALADVEDVSLQGGPAAWTVSVTVRSPDVDCDQYANWWEVVTLDGELVYRRILNHSHPDEQPFTRSSAGTVELDADTVYRVRAHLHPAGYGGQVLEGRPGEAFAVATVEEGWAEDLATAEPLPTECWY